MMEGRRKQSSIVVTWTGHDYTAQSRRLCDVRMVGTDLRSLREVVIVDDDR
jgi:hypothetical protein